MGKLTRFTGGQIVTEGTGANAETEERNFVISTNAIDDTTGFVEGNIYLIPSEITNSVELTGITFTDTSVVGISAVNRVVRVSGEEGASFFLSYSGGATGDTGTQTIPEGATFVDTTVAIPAQTDTSVDTFTATLNIGVGEIETIFSDALIADPTLQSTSIMNTALQDGSNLYSWAGYSFHNNDVHGSTQWSNPLSINRNSNDGDNNSVNRVTPHSPNISTMYVDPSSSAYAQGLRIVNFAHEPVDSNGFRKISWNWDFVAGSSGNGGTGAIFIQASGYTPQQLMTVTIT